MSGKSLKVNLVANTSQFKSAMTQTSNQIKLLNSEFRSAAAETDKYGNKLDSTGAKKKQLNGVIEQYRHRIKAIKDEQKHWTNELKKGNITEEQHAEKQKELARRLNNTEAEMKRYEGQLKKLNAEGKKTRMTFDEFDKKFRDVGRTMRNVSAQVGITTGVAFMALKRVLTDVVQEASSFHAQMSEVQAISGATAEEMKVLTDQSKDLGRATKFTAQEAAESQANLARAGFKVNEIYDAMPGLLDLAASSNLELGSAANITSNIIRTFGFEANKAGKVADVLAKGAATANTDVAGLGQAMEVAGPVAKSLEISLESVAASAGIMADAGIDGSKSGRMLRQGMLRLSKPTGDAAKVLKKMGVNAFDTDGNMKSLDKVVAELEKGMKGYTKQQKASALATIFGSESTAGWTVLLDKGSKELAKYTKELENSEGAAKEMAEVMQDNAEGAIIRMQSALSGLKIELGEKLLPNIGKAADFIGDLANKMSEMDEATIQTIAETALLVTAVLGVTTAVAGLVAGIGAFMAFAGPVGLAIGGITALLGLAAAASYKHSVETKNLAEEQEKARQEALRYGDGLSEGTKKGVKGYVDLYEGAKLKMLELKSMSGEEAEKTVEEIRKAFEEMGDTVIAELEKQRDDLTRVIQEIYAVAGEYGKEAAEELSSEVVARFQQDISEYEKAVSTVTEIIDKHGADVSKYPEDVRKAYDKSISIMDQGSTKFAQSHEELLSIQKNISESEGRLMFDESQKYAERVNEQYKKSIDGINEWYYDKTSVIDQALAQDKITAEEHKSLMAGVEASTNEMFMKSASEREKALELLWRHTDTRGKLIDIETGQEFERQKVWDKSNESYLLGMQQRTQTDEEYLQSWLVHTKDTLKSQSNFNEQSKTKYIEQLESFIQSMGYSKDEAKKISKELVEESLSELEKGDDKAEKAGKDKGDAHKDGLESTKNKNEKAGKDISSATDKELNKNKDTANAAGKGKGTAHQIGLTGTRSGNITAGNLLSMGVSAILGKTTDGGGGTRAGTLFSSGILSRRRSAQSAGSSVAGSGERGLRSVSTSGAGSNFVAGFRGSINSGGGSIWTAAWNLGKSALSALQRSIDSRSPSRETAELGRFFGQGFNLAIDDSTKEAIKKSREMGKQSLDALSNEIDHYKHSFTKVALGIEQNKQSLVVEHTLDNKFNDLISLFKSSNDNQPLKDLLNATLQQNQILMQLLRKDISLNIDGRQFAYNQEPYITEIQNRNKKTNDAFK